MNKKAVEELIKNAQVALKKVDLTQVQRKRIFETWMQSIESLGPDIVKILKTQQLVDNLLSSMESNGISKTIINQFNKEMWNEISMETKVAIDDSVKEAEGVPKDVPKDVPVSQYEMDERLIQAEAEEMRRQALNEPPIVPKDRGPKIHKGEEAVIKNIIADIKALGGDKQAVQAVVGNLPPDLQNIWEKHKEVLGKQLWKETSAKPAPSAQSAETPNAPVEPKPKEKVVSAKNKYTHNRKVQGDPTRGMPDYKGLIPAGGDPGSGNYVRPLTLSDWIQQSELDTTKIIDGKFAGAGYEANLIAEGFQTGYLVKSKNLNTTPYQMVGPPEDRVKSEISGASDKPPVKGDVVLIGHNSRDLEKHGITRDKIPGVFVQLEDVIELGDNWWSEGNVPNYAKLDEMAKQLGWTTEKLVKKIYGANTNVSAMTEAQKTALFDNWNGATFWKLKVVQPSEINETWVKGQSVESKQPFGINAFGQRGASYRHGPGGMAPLDNFSPAEEITKAAERAEGDYKFETQTPHAIAESWGFNFDKINDLSDLLPKLVKQIGPAAMLAGGKALRLLDYGEIVYGTLATGINPLLKKLGTPGKALSDIVGVSSKIGKGPALAGPLVKGAPGKVLRAGQRASSGSVSAMAAYERYNFLYGIASGLILSVMETIGIVAQDSFGQNSIREALGTEYFDWAADNGVIDMIGPYPLIDSLRQAEAEGILSDGFVEEYQDWTNDKWVNVLYEFLGTEGYQDMESINVVWRDKRLPKNWLGSMNDVFGLQSNSKAMNASFIPETGLMPAIKRSPIISGIEIPFENWFLPKVGLEEWVTPMDEYIYGSSVYDEMEEYANVPSVDNTAWLGNAMNAGG